MIITDFDVAIVEGDTHIGQWVLEHRSLAIAEHMIGQVRKHIKRGSTVIDCGANIGDHTVTYSRLVGQDGCVLAFECNPAARECLEYNLKHCQNNCVAFRNPLWSVSGRKLGLVTDPNVGATHVSAESAVEESETTTIDDVLAEFRRLGTTLRTVSLIKMDIEGAEVDVLIGAKDTIEQHQPVMMIEVNKGALKRLGRSDDELLSMIGYLGYEWSMVYPEHQITDPQYDIICVPKQTGRKSWRNR